MKLDELVTSVKDTLTVRRVYGDPYERDGVTVIPAASFAGGGGGGEGHDPEGQEGQGGGFGIGAKPAGAYVITGDTVRWHPAIDVNRLALALVAFTAVVAIARMRLVGLRTRHGSGR